MNGKFFKKNKQEDPKAKSTINKVLQEIKNNQDLGKVLTDEKIYKNDGYAYKIAEEMGGRLKASQLRKIFEKIKHIEQKLEKDEDYKKDIFELYPRLAYAKGRKLLPDDFYKLLIHLLERAEQNKKNAEIVVKFITSIVAYHKFHNPNA